MGSNFSSAFSSPPGMNNLHGLSKSRNFLSFLDNMRVHSSVFVLLLLL